MHILCVQVGSTSWDVVNLEECLKSKHVTIDSTTRSSFQESAYAGKRYDAVLQVGLTPGDDEGIAFLQRLRAAFARDIPVVVASHHADPDVIRRVASVENTKYVLRRVDNPALILDTLRCLVPAQQTALSS